MDGIFSVYCFDNHHARATAQRYIDETERYDRTVCTGRIGKDGILPANDKEHSLICRHAREIEKRLLEESGVRWQDFNMARSFLRSNNNS